MTELITVTTPLHAAGNVYLREAWQSLVDQTFHAWRWLILCNRGGEVPQDIASDPRVTVLREELGGVGALKNRLGFKSETPFTIELDCDDVLHPEALQRVAHAFSDSDVDFVYSDCAQFKYDPDVIASWNGYPYNPLMGWDHYPLPFRGKPVFAMEAPPVTAQNLRYVFWAPDHLRAWRTTLYKILGGHDPALPVADDHDLMVRMFLAGATFKHIPECLYFYRVHNKNTVGLQNAAIQDGTKNVYNKYIWKLAEKFAADNDLLKVDLCGAIDCPEGYLPIDNNLKDSHGIRCNLEGSWKLKNKSVGVLRAHDAIEHLRDPVHTMNEAYRVLAPGGFFMISVPSSEGKGAFCDPTHVSYWNDLSFRYYTDQNFSRYVPRFYGRFQLSKVIEWFPSDWHKEVRMPYVEAHLIRLGEGYEPMGEVLWPTRHG